MTGPSRRAQKPGDHDDTRTRLYTWVAFKLSEAQLLQRQSLEASVAEVTYRAKFWKWHPVTWKTTVERRSATGTLKMARRRSEAMASWRQRSAMKYSSWDHLLLVDLAGGRRWVGKGTGIWWEDEIWSGLIKSWINRSNTCYELMNTSLFIH